MLCHTKSKKCVRRPSRPPAWNADPDTWLSSVDIERVLRQYEQVWPDFSFAGVVPRDFHTVRANNKCVYACDFDVDGYVRRGKKRIAYVVNLDAHGQPGSHWVALWVDMVRKGIFYYDSTGSAPPRDVLRFIAHVRRVAKASRIDLVPAVNTIERQFQNNECGVFALTFVALMLETEMTFDETVRVMGNDDHMKLMRYVFYT